MGKENIETLNYEKKKENYGSNYKFFERKVSISTLSGFKFVHTSVLYPLTLQVTVDQQASSLKLTLVLLAILSS